MSCTIRLNLDRSKNLLSGNELIVIENHYLPIFTDKSVLKFV